MKLHLLDEVTPNASGLVCRQSRFAGILATIVFVGILVGAPIFWWNVQAPWIVWGGCGLLAILVVPILLGDLVAKFRPTNWLVWIQPDGMWINFRSYQDDGPTDVRTVLQLDYSEIAEARRHVETFSTPDSEGGSTRDKLQSLELQLTHDKTDELQAALSEDRRRTPTERVYLRFIRASSRPCHFAVSLPASDRLRIAWRGGKGSWVAPSLATVLRELDRHVRIAEPSRLDRPDWRQLNDEDFDALVLDLVHAGARLDATKLLVERRGYTTTEAHQFVKELSCRI